MYWTHTGRAGKKARVGRGTGPPWTALNAVGEKWPKGEWGGIMASLFFLVTVCICSDFVPINFLTLTYPLCISTHVLRASTLQRKGPPALFTAGHPKLNA